MRRDQGDPLIPLLDPPPHQTKLENTKLSHMFSQFCQVVQRFFLCFSVGFEQFGYRKRRVRPVSEVSDDAARASLTTA